jgi:hypothetical protein
LCSRRFFDSARPPLPDVMIIADEVDAQQTQTMDAFAKAGPKSAVA